MLAQACLLAACLIPAADPRGEDSDDPQAGRNAVWQTVFDRTAANYVLFRDKEQMERLQLHPAPVYKWMAAAADNRLFGSVYVWTYEGCVENVACFWHSLLDNVNHEIHSLSPVVLNPARTGKHVWKPTRGLQRQSIASAPPPATEASARLAQMQHLAKSFSAHTVPAPGERTELSLLSAPLYRYQSTNADVIDGALFAFVCSIGTDPELFLLLEARKTDEEPRWHYALARFSHLDTFVEYEGNHIWKSVRGIDDTIVTNADNTYLMFSEAPE